MKIAMIGEFKPYNSIGRGITSHIEKLSKELIEKGHEVFIVTYPPKINKDIDGIHVIGARGINTKYLRVLSIMFSGKKELEKLVKNENIDIIHAHTIFPQGAVAIDIGKKYNIPTYVTAHGPGVNTLPNISFFRKQIKKVLEKSDKVLGVSQDLVNKINALNIDDIQKKTSVHLNAVDIEKFKENSSKSKNKKPVVVYVGALEKIKNIDLLLDAKKQSIIDYELVLVGDGPESNKLKKRVKNENIKNVKFLGYRRDVENILPQTDLFVLPSFSEGLSIAVIEALACGLPVIGSNIDGMKELITPDVGLLIDPNNSASLNKAIEKILSNNELCTKFKSNARRRAMKFSQMKIPYEELK